MRKLRLLVDFLGTRRTMCPATESVFHSEKKKLRDRRNADRDAASIDNEK
jgi:hypothetical protein